MSRDPISTNHSKSLISRLSNVITADIMTQCV